MGRKIEVWTREQAQQEYARGATSLLELAAMWGVSQASAYHRLYGAPMPAPVRISASRGDTRQPRRKGA